MIYNIYILEEIQKEVQAEMEIRRQMEREIQALKGKSNYTLMHCFIATNDFDKKKKKKIFFASSYFRLHVIKNAIQ